MRRATEEWGILGAVFLDLLGFGMLVADIQLRAEKLTPAGWPKGLIIGALLGSTFVIQLLVSPKWGHFSDRRGRKPVVVACTVLSALAMLTYGFASSIWILLLSRVLSGLGAANVAVAQAFISDRYEGEKRTAALGRIGAAISLGLIVGPPLGGFLSHLASSNYFNAPPQFLVGIVAGTASLVGAAAVTFTLPDVPPAAEQSPGKRPVIDLTLLRDLPHLRPLILIATVAWISLATLEGTFARLIEHYFGYGALEFGFLFGYESLLAIVVQGAILAWILRRWKETPLLRSAYVLQGVGLALNPASALFAPTIPPLVTLFGASTLYAFGSSVANPTVNGLCSRLAPDDRQGELFGLLQGARSLGFVVGPMVGGVLFDWIPAAPYLLAGGVCVAAALLVPKTD
ncbi:MFS transporter [Fimbriimonas ginsengisoli]|uniref:Major facilitator superfamily MFS_1 transporter n=1 Tax=Fimbriimonas ginsengisoli Gsoil 348 TaxID=661478 RepID=A0A068NWM1_FIMGI|nr:MFS transporter [Fimbriimonas ginsengisoli]AIE87846.1 major facilitator superfamily MFS_1 transporter [Fimbriimonas ginsengisoli Gsoil 348]